MEQPYANFVRKVWDKFPHLAKLHNLENPPLLMWNKDQFMEVEYQKF